MKIVRYLYANQARYGELQDDKILPLEGTIDKLAPTKGASPVALNAVKLLAPTTPSKVVAVGPNYKAHLKGNPPPERPYYWFKPSTAINDPEGEIRLPPNVPMVCHESELAIVIGRTASRVPRSEAAKYVLGYTCINDVTAGDMLDMTAFMQSQYFVDGKIYDTFAPVGPVIVTDLNPADLRIQCRVNGETRQNHRTSDMIFPPDQLVSLISNVLTLLPGDVIATGSPPGVGPIKAGDTIEVEVEGVGVLRNRAVART